MKKYIDKITPQVRDAWRADEVYTKVRGDLKYLFALRYHIAQYHKSMEDTLDSHNTT